MARATAYGRPGRYNVPLGTDTFLFEDDGSIPNSRLPLIVRQGAITPSSGDPAKAFEQTFAKNGWTNSWRDGIFDYHHYHSTAHEVIGLAVGSATVRFGGEGGETIGLTAGDVVVIPAGVGHARMAQSDGLLVVGAYAGGRDWDIVRDTDSVGIAAARSRIAAVPLPSADRSTARAGRS
ncbi:MAG TPA: cupin domain-containing protein [Beijerinckiaceae bacterium]